MNENIQVLIWLSLNTENREFQVVTIDAERKVVSSKKLPSQFQCFSTTRIRGFARPSRRFIRDGGCINRRGITIPPLLEFNVRFQKHDASIFHCTNKRFARGGNWLSGSPEKSIEVERRNRSIKRLND